MERYAPNKMELASRDVVSRAEQTEIEEGRGFPDGTVALDVTVVPRKRIHEALREIVLVGRDFAGVERRVDPALGGVGVRADGVDLAEDPDRDPLLGRRQSRPLAGQAGADHQYVVGWHGRDPIDAKSEEAVGISGRSPGARWPPLTIDLCSAANR